MYTAVVWQLMRAYTLSVLQKLAGSSKPISDAQIVEWTNATLSEAGKSSSITGFKDPAITTSMPVIDLIDAIKPGAIKYELVNSGSSDEVSDVEIFVLSSGTCISRSFKKSVIPNEAHFLLDDCYSKLSTLHTLLLCAYFFLWRYTIEKSSCSICVQRLFCGVCVSVPYYATICYKRVDKGQRPAYS